MSLKKELLNHFEDILMIMADMVEIYLEEEE
jgi:hypothetical protein